MKRKKILLGFVLATALCSQLFLGAFSRAHAQDVAPAPSGGQTTEQIQKEPMERPAFSLGTVSLRKENGGRFDVDVEIARTSAELEYGLMGVEDVGTKVMFFDFSDEFKGKPQKAGFWMKDTPCSLDIIFLDKDGKILNIAKNTKPNDLTPHYSKGEILFVLELKGGRSDDLGLRPGDKVTLFEIERSDLNGKMSAQQILVHSR